jgi:uncharacterized protein YhbP (UPF0306 family)
MQVATVQSGRPWICTVHFVADGQQLYWLSLPSRRHSREIAANDKVAVAIMVKPEQPVIGIQIEGRAAVVEDSEIIKKVMKSYVQKFGIGQKFYDNFVSGKNQHQLYRFTPETFVLFDEEHFAGDQARQEWQAA